MLQVASSHDLVVKGEDKEVVGSNNGAGYRRKEIKVAHQKTLTCYLLSLNFEIN